MTLLPIFVIIEMYSILFHIYIYIYNALALPILLYVKRNLDPWKKGQRRLTSIEIKFFRTTGYIRFDHKGNEEILYELKVEPVDEKLRK